MSDKLSNLNAIDTTQENRHIDGMLSSDSTFAMADMEQALLSLKVEMERGTMQKISRLKDNLAAVEAELEIKTPSEAALLQKVADLRCRLEVVNVDTLSSILQGVCDDTQNTAEHPATKKRKSADMIFSKSFSPVAPADEMALRPNRRGRMRKR